MKKSIVLFLGIFLGSILVGCSSSATGGPGFRSRFETTSLDKNLVNAKCPLGHFAGHSVADALLHNPSTAERVASNSTGLFMPSRP